MRRAAGILLAGTLVLASCSSGDDDASVAPVATSAAATTTTTVTRSTATTAAAPSTTAAAPSTTAPPATTGTTPTTAAPPTTVALPTPEPPPPEDGTTEPRVQVGSIEIPAIGLSASMFEGIRLSTLNNGPGHWPGTAMPGEVGNVVVGGHRTSKHRVFRHIDELVAGDQIIFDDADGEHIYIVNRVEIVSPTDVWIINPTDTPTATLFACHPPGSTRQRIVVFADLQV
jgi:sortase A